MIDPKTWNWTVEKRQVADLQDLRSKHTAVHESVASPDGEAIGTPVMDDETCLVVVNGKAWEPELEKAWSLKFLADGRLTALVQSDDEWTVAVDGKLWEETFDFAWNTKISADGLHIAAQTKQGMDYGLAIDGEPWEQTFQSCRDYSINADASKAAGSVQVEKLPEADIWKFMEGTWSIAVDGTPWPTRYINVYCPIVSDAGRVAAEVRLGIDEYSFAEDNKLWDARFGAVWQGLFRPGGAYIAPVRVDGGWSLAQSGRPLWERKYVQLWRVNVSADDRHVAAVVAPAFGQWTVAIDDKPWEKTFSDVVLSPVFSPDGSKVGAVVKDHGQWSICVDGQCWAEDYAMAWDPVFSSRGDAVAKVQRADGSYSLALNGRTWSRRGLSQLWDPTFSPDGDKLMVRYVEGGKAYREVVTLQSMAAGI